MKTQFTKGEWRQSHRISDKDGNYSTQVYDDNGKTICTLAWHSVPIKGGSITDREANAKLIAAAPDMFEALHLLIMAKNRKDSGKKDLEYENIKLEGWFKARKAIKKATE